MSMCVYGFLACRCISFTRLGNFYIYNIQMRSSSSSNTKQHHCTPLHTHKTYERHKKARNVCVSSFHVYCCKQIFFSSIFFCYLHSYRELKQSSSSKSSFFLILRVCHLYRTTKIVFRDHMNVIHIPCALYVCGFKTIFFSFPFFILDEEIKIT